MAPSHDPRPASPGGHADHPPHTATTTEEPPLRAVAITSALGLLVAAATVGLLALNVGGRGTGGGVVVEVREVDVEAPRPTPRASGADAVTRDVAPAGPSDGAHTRGPDGTDGTDGPAAAPARAGDVATAAWYDGPADAGQDP